MVGTTAVVNTISNLAKGSTKENIKFLNNLADICKKTFSNKITLKHFGKMTALGAGIAAGAYLAYRGIKALFAPEK